MASVGLFGIAAVVLLAYVGFNAPNAIPGRSYYNVDAQFYKADNLTPHDQVRLGGKLVGQILDLKVVDGKAQMKLQMDPDVKGKLYKDATIEVRPRSAVGVRYVDLKPGTANTGMLPEGGLIPADHTKITETLDEALATFDPATQKNIPKFFQGLGQGFAGRGEDINQLLGDAPATLQGTRDVLGAVAARKGSVKSFIGGTSTLATAFDPVRIVQAQAFKPEDRALQPFTQERTAVHTVLETAPPAFSSISKALPAVQPFLRETEGLAKAVRPALAAGPYAFGQTSALLHETHPGLKNTTATLKIADKAVDPTLRLLDTVRPILPEFESTMTDATPVLSSLGAYGCDITQFGNHWGSMMHYGNQSGGALRFDVLFGPESVYGQQTRQAGTHAANGSPAPCTVPYDGSK